MIHNWGCPVDLLTNQTVLDPKVHTSREPQVGIEPTSPPTKVVALPTKPQILTDIEFLAFDIGVSWISEAIGKLTSLNRSWKSNEGTFRALGDGRN
jgi:hypothetical protein